MKPLLSIIGTIAVIAWWMLASWVASGCAAVHANPSNPNWREDQQTCERFIGADRNHVRGETVAEWCSRRENSDRVLGTIADMGTLTEDIDAAEKALLDLLDEAKKLAEQ